MNAGYGKPDLAGLSETVVAKGQPRREIFPSAAKKYAPLGVAST